MYVIYNKDNEDIIDVLPDESRIKGVSPFYRIVHMEGGTFEEDKNTGKKVLAGGNPNKLSDIPEAQEAIIQREKDRGTTEYMDLKLLDYMEKARMTLICEKARELATEDGETETINKLTRLLENPLDIYR